MARQIWYKLTVIVAFLVSLFFYTLHQGSYVAIHVQLQQLGFTGMLFSAAIILVSLWLHWCSRASAHIGMSLFHWCSKAHIEIHALVQQGSCWCIPGSLVQQGSYWYLPGFTGAAGVVCISMFGLNSFNGAAGLILWLMHLCSRVHIGVSLAQWCSKALLMSPWLIGAAELILLSFIGAAWLILMSPWLI